MSLELPEEVRFGTSSWAYEGWQGLVYKKHYSKQRFSRDCLAEYASYEYRGKRLFRTVGVDHTFYRPATDAQMAEYAGQLPAGFLVCSKVWEEITIPAYARLPRYGCKGGGANPRFLDASLCEELVLQPVLAGLGSLAGPFIFEFQRSGVPAEDFMTRLDRFFSQLPSDRSYAVEVRQPNLLGPRYHDLLRAHGVCHVYNHWTAMPPLAAQHAVLAKSFTAPHVVVRLLTPLGMSYADAAKRAAPYARLVDPQPQMRTDTVGLIRQAIEEKRKIFVLANNRAEGHAPLTVQALVDLLTRPPG
jgi:uncharacterized protein YecE (DUF72 family)